ncbi:TPA: hypothetical protein N0F65_000608 [Lagenidium giganteum]|uniref:Ankyrin repeat protein n=1 Tax=Lagenidium giganteum TaxID=4803 RepID=A0AAV2YMB7_9STRA|nr:TPA: hypothetical protein N0F65_000608 [Lagenidium giganteum]
MNRQASVKRLPTDIDHDTKARFVQACADGDTHQCQELLLKLQGVAHSAGLHLDELLGHGFALAAKNNRPDIMSLLLTFRPSVIHHGVCHSLDCFPVQHLAHGATRNFGQTFRYAAHAAFLAAEANAFEAVRFLVHDHALLYDFELEKIFAFVMDKAVACPPEGSAVLATAYHPMATLLLRKYPFVLRALQSTSRGGEVPDPRIGHVETLKAALRYTYVLNRSPSQ